MRYFLIFNKQSDNGNISFKICFYCYGNKKEKTNKKLNEVLDALHTNQHNFDYVFSPLMQTWCANNICGH